MYFFCQKHSTMENQLLLKTPMQTIEAALAAEKAKDLFHSVHLPHSLVLLGAFPSSVLGWYTMFSEFTLTVVFK